MVIDFATSATSLGKIELAKRRRVALHPSWAVDRNGNVATTAEEVLNGGAILPLGSTRESGGHKGYGMAAMVDIMCGVLSGANWGPFAPQFVLAPERTTGTVGKGIGHTFGALRIDSFMNREEFLGRMDAWVRTFRATKAAAGHARVVIPGDPEREAEAIRQATGIPLPSGVVSELEEISRMTGVLFEK